MKTCREATKILTTHIRDQRETTRLQFNAIFIGCLVRSGHETKDKTNLTIDLRREENKSNIEQNGKGSTI